MGASRSEAERIRDFGSGGRMAFPDENDLFNQLTLHSRLLAGGELLLPRLSLPTNVMWIRASSGVEA